jgi:hypothetical protein
MAMTALFTRAGTAHGGAVYLTGKGKPAFQRHRTCHRCGGAGGADVWAATGWTCYGCGGTGHKGMETVRLYTEAELAKLNATAGKRAAKKAAVAAELAAAAKAEADAKREGFLAVHGELLAKAEAFKGRNEFITDVLRKAHEKAELTEKQATALAAAIERIAAEDTVKAGSGHVGKVGERITAAVTVERVASYARAAFGFRNSEETVWIVTMRDAAGNAIVSKTPRFHAEKGEKFLLTATVKEHGEYNGEKQTVVMRVKTADLAAE